MRWHFPSLTVVRPSVASPSPFHNKARVFIPLLLSTRCGPFKFRLVLRVSGATRSSHMGRRFFASQTQLLVHRVISVPAILSSSGLDPVTLLYMTPGESYEVQVNYTLYKISTAVMEDVDFQLVSYGGMPWHRSGRGSRMNIVTIETVADGM